MTREISGFNENEKMLYLVDWEKVEENCIEGNELYNKYLNAGFVCSKIAMSKKSYPLGIVSQVKTKKRGEQLMFMLVYAEYISILCFINYYFN